MYIPFSAVNALPYFMEYQDKSPLVHCMTNHVVQNFTANVLLATGGSPAMIPDIQECGEFTMIASGLLVNVGTLTERAANAMLHSAKVAHETGTPWVLDPVGIGPALYYRTSIVNQLLQYQPSVIRGNPSEIMVLAGVDAKSKGVDSEEDAKEAFEYAQNVARDFNTIVVMTGEEDIITDGDKSYIVSVGTKKLTQVTGTGCSLSALVAGMISSTEDTLEAAATACYIVALSGQIAANKGDENGTGLGTFAVQYLDELSLMTPEKLLEIAKSEGAFDEF
ncbi:hydroxyethylthiazole kinase [Ignatzschineria rhizosphaerae]|uniref:Hydroxyethylthiazole kinase n=1 Tax=Ignatzschineria rhizosphaerae TaxID=2923279 RepID=A0ABY3X319_9GAMM|nr:hydroxyethylthiazole kinase [Ignatzschineria rhizosphaerae]UNM97271.1 hydroxyethylthiazole kinase [Ignatzschineria rhizosphaerae]